MKKEKLVLLLFVMLGIMLNAGSISGNVAVTGEEPVSCDIFLSHPNPNMVVQIITVNSGEEYSFMNVYPGAYLVQIMPQSQHYYPEFYPGVPDPGSAEVLYLNNVNDELTGIDFLLEYQEPGIGGVISGTVLTETSTPVTGLEVYLYGVFNNYWNSYLTQTDEEGEFSFPEVNPGGYILYLQHYPGYQHYFWEGGHSFQTADIIIIEPEMVLDDLVLQLVPLPEFSISGTVQESDGGNYFPVEGALVSGYAMNCWGEGEFFQVITDEYGHYDAATTGGMYWLYSTKDGYFDQYWEGVASFDDATPLHINQDMEDIDFLLTSTEDPQDNSISGYISADGEEPGFPCLVIVIASDEDDDWSEITESESSGYYYIDEIPAGEYYVVMMTTTTPPVYYPEGYDWENAELVYIEGNVTGIDFEIENMTQNGVIVVEGNITSNGRDPVAGVSVVFFNEQAFPVSYGISNSDGDYSAVTIETGNYSVLANKTFYESENVELSITENNSLDFVITQIVTAEDEDTLPEVNSEIRCYPNPFLLSNSRASLSIQLYPQTAGATRISLYNLRGQLVENIYTGWMEAEPQTISWSSGDGTRDIPSGIYLISMEQSGSVQSAQKLLLIK
ncbi:MAG: T9SS type A sorting domain-containing protein [Candidatus Stygibacter australis]|nr:T9SS type A sorting domain-containing protein [Candidatus Stygibacter australis]